MGILMGYVFLTIRCLGLPKMRDTPNCHFYGEGNDNQWIWGYLIFRQSKSFKCHVAKGKPLKND